ncbi:MAG: hydantoinase B/oxoprolinase family protein [Chloroflexi bacterium]|nr:hydantoinase B/oxoprolinase family protein [Chloroflexota bacterium]
MITESFDPVLLTILGQRVETIAREVMTVMIRSARSVMINTARDFSTGIVTGDGRLLAVAEGLPIHAVNMQMTVKNILELFKGDIQAGDMFFNNCPYTGGTHTGDLAITCPVFYDDELLFWVMNRAHQADMGFHLPTTYLSGPEGADIYQEGIQLPCVRVQQNYKEIKDVIRICTMKIRSPDVWYGDYLAQVGSVRIGETRLIELCQKYGKDVVKQFIAEWFDYSSRKTAEDIRRLPAGTWEADCNMDPKDFAPQGLFVKVKVTINPDEAMIVVDLTESCDQVPAGLNMTEACSYAAGVVPLLIFLDPTIPHNDGLLRHIKVKLREGSLAGIPKYPVGTSVATASAFQTAVNAVMSALAKADITRATAHGGRPGIGNPVMSGIDHRNNKPYQNQMYLCLSGGPASMGHDGWGVHCSLTGLGATYKESVEMHELRFPHLVKKHEVITDFFAPGKWRSGASLGAVLIPQLKPLTLATFGEGKVVGAKGIAGGRDGVLAHQYAVDAVTGQRLRELDFCGIHRLGPGEGYEYNTLGAGGYGNPLERDPEKVRWDVREGLVSVRSANEDYGVVLNTEPELYEVDYAATKKLREELKRKTRRTWHIE